MLRSSALSRAISFGNIALGGTRVHLKPYMVTKFQHHLRMCIRHEADILFPLYIHRDNSRVSLLSLFVAVLSSENPIRVTLLHWGFMHITIGIAANMYTLLGDILPAMAIRMIQGNLTYQ